jgi:hypothetical protein
MINPASTSPRRVVSEGTSSAMRLQEAMRTGALRLVTSSSGNNIGSRHSAPRRPALHRVDTHADIPHGLDGVAIGHAALPAAPENRAHNESAIRQRARAEFSMAEAKAYVGRKEEEAHPTPPPKATPLEEAPIPVDPLLRSRVWRAIVVVYIAAGCLIGWLVFRG